MLSLFTNTALHRGTNDNLESVGKDFLSEASKLCFIQ